MPKPHPGKKLTVGFVADPIAGFDSRSETTFFIMSELSRRGWHSYHFELKDLFLKAASPMALAKKVAVKFKDGLFSFTILEQTTLDLAKLDALFLRKDPPVDLKFIDHLTLLELLNGQVLMVNHPTWIKHANEKIFPLHFAGMTPRTLVTQNTQLLGDFVKKEKIAILKVLNQAGGRGVIKVQGDDTSLKSIIETLSDQQNNFIMAQQYLPEATKGDKRILLLDGEILGAFLRVPSKMDFRGNLHSGARLTRCSLTKRDLEIVATITPTLQKYGLLFVGIDIIGPYCTEINTTSPMGIGEINHLNRSHTEKIVVDWLQRATTNHFPSTRCSLPL